MLLTIYIEMNDGAKRCIDEVIGEIENDQDL